MKAIPNCSGSMIAIARFSLPNGGSGPRWFQRAYAILIARRSEPLESRETYDQGNVFSPFPDSTRADVSPPCTVGSLPQKLLSDKLVGLLHLAPRGRIPRFAKGALKDGWLGKKFKPHQLGDDTWVFSQASGSRPE